MFKSSNKPILELSPLNKKDEFKIKSKKENGFMEKPKDTWSVKKKMDKPNLRLRAKMDLINEYYQKERINATQYNQFKEHLHHHSKAHIKKMLVEIHRNKKSFNQSHKIAQEVDEKRKLKNKK